MKSQKPAGEANLSGAYVRGADGRVYRVSLWGSSPKPWGRVNGGELEEIPRPFKACDGAEVVSEHFRDVRDVKQAAKGGPQ